MTLLEAAMLPDPVKYARAAGRLKYSVGNEPRAFHRAIHENPRDPFPSQVYADWLEENGHPTAAEIIRGHVAAHNAGPMIHAPGPLASGPTTGGFRLDTFRTSDGEYSFTLYHPSLDRPGHRLVWGSFPHDPQAARRIVEGAKGEGMSFTDSGIRYNATLPRPEGG